MLDHLWELRNEMVSYLLMRHVKRLNNSDELLHMAEVGGEQTIFTLVQDERWCRYFMDTTINTLRVRDNVAVKRINVTLHKIILDNGTTIDFVLYDNPGSIRGRIGNPSTCAFFVLGPFAGNNPGMPMCVKTHAEIDALKRNWELDPCWDIEETSGFEMHHQELLDYRIGKEAEWKAKESQKSHDFAKALGIPDNVFLANYISNLNKKLDQCIRQLDELQNKE